VRQEEEKGRRGKKHRILRTNFRFTKFTDEREKIAQIENKESQREDGVGLGFFFWKKKTIVNAKYILANE